MHNSSCDARPIKGHLAHFVFSKLIAIRLATQFTTLAITPTIIAQGALKPFTFGTLMTTSHHIALLCILALTLSLQACTTSMTTMTDARAYEPKEVQVAGNMQGNLHTNVINKAIQGVKAADEQFNSDQPISEEAYRDWLDLALAAALFKPGGAPELMARVGVTDKVLEGIDVGFRTNFNLYKGDLKLQIWENEAQNQAFSVMAGYTYHSSIVSSAISYLTLTDFGRMDFDLQAIWGIEIQDIFKLNLAPHMILSRVSAEQKLPADVYNRLPESIKQYDPNQLFQNEWLGYYGLNTNLMLGYKYVFVVIDTGFFWMNFKPEILGEKRDFSGAAISLAGGLSFHYPF